MAGRLKLLFFWSGAAGLSFEVIWARLLADVLGSTAASNRAVFAVFLICLAIGARMFGNLRRFGNQALRIYAGIEIGVGLSAGLATGVLYRYGAWIAVLRPQPASPLGALLNDCGTAALFLGLPTILMGASLPMVVNATGPHAATRDLAARLYAFNTLGAACGVVATGFVLIWSVGLVGAALVATLVYVAVGGYAWTLARAREATPPVHPAPVPCDGKFASGRWSWAALSCISGFAVLAYELLWGRLARMLVGEATLGVATLLFALIACLGAAAWTAPAVGRWQRTQTPQRTITATAWALLLAAACHLAAAAVAYAWIHHEGVAAADAVEGRLASRVAGLWALMAAPMFLLGLVFPLLVWSAEETDRQPGHTIGRLYGVNTLGAVGGAVAVSFAFQVHQSTATAFLAISGVLVATAAALLWRYADRRGARVAAAAALPLYAVACFTFPQSLAVLREDERLIESQEDDYGVAVLVETQARTYRMRNNRRQLVRDLGDVETARAQQMAAHWAVLLAADARTVLNIGTGYGITAGTFTLYDEVEQLETVELLPFVYERQERFADYNFGYARDPRVTLIRGDGYHRLLTATTTFDIISINVLDPHLPGSSSLYTVDLWQTAAQRLRPGGVLTQLLWGEAALPRLIRAQQLVFPTTLYLPAYGGSAYLAIAFRDPATAVSLRLRLERVGPRGKQPYVDCLAPIGSDVSRRNSAKVGKRRRILPVVLLASGADFTQKTIRS